MAGGTDTDLAELHATFDRIEAGNARARARRTRTADQAPSSEPARGGTRAPRKQPAARPSDTPDAGGGSAGGSDTPPTPASSRPPAEAPFKPLRYPAVFDTGAGVVLVFFAWAWLGLPFLKGGPAEVRKTLRAKFLNQAPDGSWLK